MKGFVLDKDSKRPIPDARIVVKGIEHYVASAENGDYWRLLAPGTYSIKVEALGYESSASRKVVVPECRPCES